MFETVIFDFDGTLVDTSRGIFNGVNYALRAMGVAEDSDPDHLRRMVGPPLREGFAANYGVDGEIATAKYREYYSVTGLFECEAFNGIDDLLCALKDSGKRVAVATIKPQEYTVRIVEALGWSEKIDVIVGAPMDGSCDDKGALIGRVIERLGGVDASRTVMVGDRVSDIEGGRQNGLKTVFCGFGFASDKVGESALADYTVDRVEQLAEVLLGE